MEQKKKNKKEQVILMTGEDLERLRKNKGLSPEQLGKLIGIKKGHYSNIENGLAKFGKTSLALPKHLRNILNILLIPPPKDTGLK